MGKGNDSSILYADIVKQIYKVRTKIDLLKKLYNVDLTEECSSLVKILSLLTENYTLYNDGRSSFAIDYLQSKLTEVVRVEFAACNKALEELVKKFSAYANELEESLVNTGELRRAINEAKRHQAKASATSHASEDVKKDVDILDKEIEDLSAASSEMRAREPEEKRRVAFRLVEIFVGFLGVLIVPYFTYTVGYLKTDPFSSNHLVGLALIWGLGCIAIYATIGAIAKVKHKSKPD